MTPTDNTHHRAILREIAHRAMIERGLLPDFSAQEMTELDAIQGPAVKTDDAIRDLRELLWCSIDNDDSEDLDQLTCAEALPNGSIRIRVAIADVDALVKKQTALDEHARHNTTSVYTAAEVFPMLPEKLSTQLTSLGFDRERLAMVVEMDIAPDGEISKSDIYRAVVRNRAKLAYDATAHWLEGKEPLPEKVGAVPGLEANLRLQDGIAQKLKERRHNQGALDFTTSQSRPVFENDRITDLVAEKTNRAKDIIADFMIAANGIVARFLTAKGFPSLRRVVRVPKRWDRIVQLAAERGHKLPVEPDSKALNQFLLAEKAADPLRFPDLSLSVIKLLGAGEYAVEMPGEDSQGHFGLAVKDYTHSTAPNRRYPDLITQRLVKAALHSTPTPYTRAELEDFARHCTLVENDVNKVERQVSKSAASILLESRIGEQFEAIITGASEKGTWVRLLKLPVEGRLTNAHPGLDVGHRLKVQLVRTDVERGYIDFSLI